MGRNTKMTPADEGIAAARADVRRARRAIGDAETAAEAVERNAKLSRSLLARLELKVDDLQHEANEDPKNWGYAGDLGNIRDKLLNLLVGFECHQFDGDEERTREAILRSL